MIPFDFSAFNTLPPRGMRVICADKECLRLERTGAKPGIFTVTKTEPETFSLWYQNTMLDDGKKFVMKSDLARVLKLLGYGTQAAPFR